MGTKYLSRPSRSCAAAQIEMLEQRRLLNAAVLRHGRLTVYCTDNASVSFASPNSTDLVDVFFASNNGGSIATVNFEFSGPAIKRIRILENETGTQIVFLADFSG